MKESPAIEFDNSKDSSIEGRIGAIYPDLSAQLSKAADFVIANPVDLATRSLRYVAEQSGVSPATFSRLARVLGYSSFEEMRDARRVEVVQKIAPFSDRARDIHINAHDKNADYFLEQQAKTCQANIGYLLQNIPAQRLDDAVDALYNAKKVLLTGAKASSGIVEYFSYLAQWFAHDWIVGDSGGKSIAASLVRMTRGDVVFVLTKTPYAKRSIRTLKEAKSLGLTTLTITDSHTSPALKFADYGFVVPTDSSNFFSSYTTTVVILETMMSILVAKVGPEAEERIRATEDQILSLEENWSN